MWSLRNLVHRNKKYKWTVLLEQCCSSLWTPSKLNAPNHIDLLSVNFCLFVWCVFLFKVNENCLTCKKGCNLVVLKKYLNLWEVSQQRLYQDLSNDNYACNSFMYLVTLFHPDHQNGWGHLNIDYFITPLPIEDFFIFFLPKNLVYVYFKAIFINNLELQFGSFNLWNMPIKLMAHRRVLRMAENNYT